MAIDTLYGKLDLVINISGLSLHALGRHQMQHVLHNSNNFYIQGLPYISYFYQ